MAPTLGYWSIRGLAEPLRYLLAYTATEFEEKMYDFGPEAATSKDAWLAEKEKLGLEFPNLPYYIDGDLKLTESTAIAGHIARKHKLAGDCETEWTRLAVAHGLSFDVLIRFAMISYDPEFESKKEAFIADAPPLIEKLAKLVGSGDYILGNKISHEDFYLFETLERCVDMIPDCLAPHANLLAYHKRIASLPAIAKHRDTAAFQQRKRRFCARFASFGAGDY